VSAPTTRERILEVAQRRFIDHGYDATSLREIAEELGFTKAALYYHFQSKEELLQALLAPGEALIEELMSRLEAAGGVEGWADTLVWVIGLMADNFHFFLLMERNRAAIETLKISFASPDHLRMHERVQAAVFAQSSDLTTQVRMFAALGAVTAFDDWAPRLLFSTPVELLQPELIAAVRDILRLAPVEVTAP
jgi:AcrR family transcriptional regulator